MSPGLEFETRLVARPEAPEILVRELQAKSYRPAVIAKGTNTDPYQPIERTHRIVRGILEVLHECRHPVAIVTKGTLIERDVDLLGEMGRLGLARAGISVTTLDARLARRWSREHRRRNVGSRRFDALRRRVSRAGHGGARSARTDRPRGRGDPCGGRRAGAIAASWIMLRLPLEVSPLFQEWLAEHFPDRAKRIMGRGETCTMVGTMTLSGQANDRSRDLCGNGRTPFLDFCKAAGPCDEAASPANRPLQATRAGGRSAFSLLNSTRCRLR